jgi:hypothetical protein
VHDSHLHPAFVSPPPNHTLLSSKPVASVLAPDCRGLPRVCCVHHTPNSEQCVAPGHKAAGKRRTPFAMSHTHPPHSLHMGPSLRSSSLPQIHFTTNFSVIRSTATRVCRTPSTPSTLRCVCGVCMHVWKFQVFFANHHLCRCKVLAGACGHTVSALNRRSIPSGCASATASLSALLDCSWISALICPLPGPQRSLRVGSWCVRATWRSGLSQALLAACVYVFNAHLHSERPGRQTHCTATCCTSPNPLSLVMTHVHVDLCLNHSLTAVLTLVARATFTLQ